MSITSETTVQFPARRAIGSDKRGRKKLDTLAAELQAALAREQALLADKHDLTRVYAPPQAAEPGRDNA